MKIKHYTLPEHALGGQRQLSHFHFGAPGTGEMLVLHYLKRLLSQAERRGELRGEIILVPVANPPGLAQVLLSSGIGRFDLASGRNFNRDFPDLAALAQAGLPADLPGTRPEYLQRVRAAMREALAALPAVSEAQALRHHLLSLACDADLVLDLHCDDQAILHLYADPAWQREAKVLAAFLGIGAVLLSQESGGNSFDEACGLPWQRLCARNPSWRQQQPGCMAVTVELRGQQEVNHATACDDAERIYRYLQYRGVLARGSAAGNGDAAVCRRGDCHRAGDRHPGAAKTARRVGQRRRCRRGNHRSADRYGQSGAADIGRPDLCQPSGAVCHFRG